MATMLVTRPEPDAEDTGARLRALDIAAVTAPMLLRVTLPTSLPDPRGFAALALTSANALRSLAERDAITPYRALKVFAVGERTALAARDHGFAEIVPAGGTLAHLVETIAHAGLAGPVFYPAASRQSGDLAKSLAPFGVMVVTARIYEMRPPAALPGELLADLERNRFAAALFYSRRTAESFATLVGGHLDRRARARLGVLCLTEQVAEPLIAAHFVRVALADQPSEDAMMALALSFAREQNAS
jgi:uroporphyrinogen-III synthase